MSAEQSYITIGRPSNLNIYQSNDGEIRWADGFAHGVIQDNGSFMWLCERGGRIIEWRNRRWEYQPCQYLLGSLHAITVYQGCDWCLSADSPIQLIAELPTARTSINLELDGGRQLPLGDEGMWVKKVSGEQYVFVRPSAISHIINDLLYVHMYGRHIVGEYNIDI